MNQYRVTYFDAASFTVEYVIIPAINAWRAALEVGARHGRVFEVEEYYG